MDGFVFNRQDDETLVISLNGKEITTLNHDEDGWQGMERGENIIRSVASALNIKVTEI